MSRPNPSSWVVSGPRGECPRPPERDYQEVVWVDQQRDPGGRLVPAHVEPASDNPDLNVPIGSAAYGIHPPRCVLPWNTDFPLLYHVAEQVSFPDLEGLMEEGAALAGSLYSERPMAGLTSRDVSAGDDRFVFFAVGRVSTSYPNCGFGSAFAFDAELLSSWGGGFGFRPHDLYEAFGPASGNPDLGSLVAELGTVWGAPALELVRAYAASLAGEGDDRYKHLLLEQQARVDGGAEIEAWVALLQQAGADPIDVGWPGRAIDAKGLHLWGREDIAWTRSGSGGGWTPEVVVNVAVPLGCASFYRRRFKGTPLTGEERAELEAMGMDPDVYPVEPVDVWLPVPPEWHGLV